MDARDFAIFYPRLAAQLRQIEVDAMPGWTPMRRGLRPAGQVLPEATVVTAVFVAVTVWLVLGLTRGDWAGWLWIPTVMIGLVTLRGIGKTARCARTLVTYRRRGD